MFKTGQLPELLGFPVLDVRLETKSEVAIAPNFVNLSQWLQNLNFIQPGWQTVEELLRTQQLHLAYSRSGGGVKNVTRAKLIDFGMQLACHPVALVAYLNPEADETVNILLQIRPVAQQNYLPPSLELIVLDELEETFLTAKSRQADNWIQLEFSGSAGERFSVKVALDNTSFRENFVI
jgi:hypothetical protein